MHNRRIFFLIIFLVLNVFASSTQQPLQLLILAMADVSNTFVRAFVVFSAHALMQGRWLLRSSLSNFPPHHHHHHHQYWGEKSRTETGRDHGGHKMTCRSCPGSDRATVLKVLRLSPSGDKSHGDRDYPGTSRVVDVCFLARFPRGCRDLPT